MIIFFINMEKSYRWTLRGFLKICEGRRGFKLYKSLSNFCLGLNLLNNIAHHLDVRGKPEVTKIFEIREDNPEMLVEYIEPCLPKTSIISDQIRSVDQSCPTLYDPMNRSTPGLPVHHQLQEFTQTHIHRVSDAIQPSHPLSSPSPPAPNPSQHQSLFQRVNSSREVAKVLEFQL